MSSTPPDAVLAPRRATSQPPTLRWAVLTATLPAPTGADAASSSPRLPGLGALDLDATDFWDRFRDNAPLHLRAGLALGVWAIGALLPRLMGSWRSMRGLPPARRDAVVQRAERLPVFRDLLDIVKLVAAMAYFRDDEVQALVRGGSVYEGQARNAQGSPSREPTP